VVRALEDYRERIAPLTSAPAGSER
jgi:hypothetical protein